MILQWICQLVVIRIKIKKWKKIPQNFNNIHYRNFFNFGLINNSDLNICFVKYYNSNKIKYKLTLVKVPLVTYSCNSSS